SALDKVGVFDIATIASADWDFWLQLSRQSSIAFVDRVVIGYRQHTQNISNNVKKMERAERYIRYKLMSSPELSQEQRSLARAGYRCAVRHKLRNKINLAHKS